MFDFKRGQYKMRKAQAAMEFLMTYGWAILVVIVAVGSLAYFGVLGGSVFLPERCVIAGGKGLFCEDFSASPGKIILRVRNTLADSVQVTEAYISQGGNSCNLTAIEPPGPIAPDSASNLILSTGPTCSLLTMPGTKLSGDISITFIKKYFPKTATGDMIASTGESISVEDQNICYNADTYELCGGLYIVFGEGYREACCNVFGLCC